MKGRFTNFYKFKATLRNCSNFWKNCIITNKSQRYFECHSPVQQRLGVIHRHFTRRVQLRMSMPQLPLARVQGLNPISHPTPLESSLHQLVEHHQLQASKLRDQTEKAKKEAVWKASRVSELLVDSVNGGVQESFINERRIEDEIRALTVTVARYKKQTDQWLAASRSINNAIKEIGDFENWMKIMEYDCKSITAAIHNIHQS